MRDGAGNDVLVLRNTIVAGNTGGDCGFSTGFVPDMVGTNMASDNTCGTGPGMIVADPVLGALASNGGPTKTHALLAGSPAIDAATDCGVTTDQRYVARPQGAACDIGAFEFDDYITVSIKLDASAAVNSNTGVAVVTGTLTCSKPLSVELSVSLRQQQKIGRVNAVAQASDVTVVNCLGSKAWSIALAPSSGGFKNGVGSITAQTTNTVPGVTPGAAAATVKMFWGHK